MRMLLVQLSSACDQMGRTMRSLVSRPMSQMLLLARMMTWMGPRMTRGLLTGRTSLKSAISQASKPGGPPVGYATAPVVVMPTTVRAFQGVV